MGGRESAPSPGELGAPNSASNRTSACTCFIGVIYQLQIKCDIIVINNSQQFFDTIKGLDRALLLVAITEGKLDHVRNLIEIVGTNTAVNDIYPLILASDKGHTKIVQLLIQNNVHVNVKDEDGDTALHVAVFKNRWDICKLLVENGADINLRNNKNITPVMIAAVRGLENILKYLAGRAETNLNIGNSENQTALHLAVRSSQITSVEVLLTYGTDAKALDNDKISPFHLGAIKGDVRIMEVFLKKKAASLVDSQNEDKLAAIHLAVLNDNQECLKLLIEYNADKNIRDKTMCTALHFAALFNKFECLKILIERGADPNLKDENGNTPLHLAACVSTNKMLKGFRSLLGFMGGIQIFPDSDNGPDRSKSIITYLVEHGAFLYFTNNDQKTPLELCLDPILKIVLISLESQRQQEEEIQKKVEIQELRNNINRIRDQDKCKMCKQGKANMVFQCGHKSCNECSNSLSRCYNCGVSITSRIELKF